MKEKIFSKDWNSILNAKPKDGSIVEVMTQRQRCSCGGMETVECYYDSKGGFRGIKNQAFVRCWRLSPANDLIKDLEKRELVCAVDCVNCLN